jgi:hypothetical protein
MRRRSTMLSSAAAAAFAALAVTVAAPAIGDDGPDSGSVDDVVACLREHGLQDAPSGAALKPWLGERLVRGEATTSSAIAACIPDGSEDARRGAVARDVRVCVVRRGGEVGSSDPGEMKRRSTEHADDPAGREVRKRCDVGPPPDIACAPGAPEDPATTATPAPAAPAEPGT